MQPASPIIRKSVLGALFAFLPLSTAPLPAQITLEERGQAAGIWTTFQSYGVSVADYDRDGWDDILIVGRYGVALFRNNKDATFTDVTQAAGLRFTAHFVIGLFADLDNDGDSDLFLGRRDGGDRNHVFLNENGSFVDLPGAAGIDTAVSIGSAAVGDYDNDGFVDLFLSTRGAADQLYRNTSDGSGIAFENVSSLSAMGGLSFSIGMQPTWIDFDHDGDQDLFVVHDAFDLSRLYMNDGALPFPNIATPMNIANVGAGNSMGVTWGDYDRDGWQDVYVSRIDSAGLYRYAGSGPFQDVAALAGADSNGMTWGVTFADLDNDGWEDLPMVNVSSFGGTHPRSLLYRNNGNGTFTDVGDETGFSEHRDFYGLASGDFDNDGRVDLVGASFYPIGENRLWMNRTTGGNSWVRLRLEGRGGVNTMGIGARIRAVTPEGTHVRSLLAGSGYCSQMSPVIHIGLGSATTVDTLEIFWKGGHSETITALPADSLYDIRRSQTTAVDELPNLPVQPGRIEILGIHPNPFNSTTRLVFRLDVSGPVRIALFDMLGREVKRLHDGWMSDGEHSVRIEASGMASGIFYAAIFVAPRVAISPILLIK